MGLRDSHSTYTTLSDSDSEKGMLTTENLEKAIETLRNQKDCFGQRLNMG